MRRKVIALAATALIMIGVAPGSSGERSSRAPATAELEALVPEMSAGDLAARLGARMAGSGRVLLLDVREAPEFAVSHIEGALRIDERTPVETLLALLGARVKATAVVLYCTLGPRSSDYAQGLYHDALDAGARSVHVLQGGLIAWHNERRPLVDANGPTPFVHPHDAVMQTQLTRPDLVRFEPFR